MQTDTDNQDHKNSARQSVERESKNCTAEKGTTENCTEYSKDDSVDQNAQDEGVLNIEDPAAFLNFPDHESAVQALLSLGYKDATTCAQFTPCDLLDEVNALVKEEGLVVMDMTTTIPVTPQAAYKALTIAGFTAAAACRKDKNVAFLIMRTDDNAPSFLFGHHWSLAQTLGKSYTENQMRLEPTPAVFVIFRERQFSLPSSVFKSDVCVAARLIARELTMKNSLFACCICGETFVETRSTTACLCVSEFGLAPCKHLFHRQCAENHVRVTGSRECPACTNQVIL